MEKSVESLELQRKTRLEIVDKDYYNPKSKHYKDNERYRWAVTTINKKIDEEIQLITNK